MRTPVFENTVRSSILTVACEVAVRRSLAKYLRESTAQNYYVDPSSKNGELRGTTAMSTAAMVRLIDAVAKDPKDAAKRSLLKTQMDIRGDAAYRNGKLRTVAGHYLSDTFRDTGAPFPGYDHSPGFSEKDISAVGVFAFKAELLAGGSGSTEEIVAGMHQLAEGGVDRDFNIALDDTIRAVTARGASVSDAVGTLD